MPPSDLDKEEKKKLVKAFSDKARKKIAVVGNDVFIPHKLTPSGEIVNKDNFDRETCLSKLELTDLQLLVLWKENKWNDEATLAKCGLAKDQAEKTLKKLAYFKTEDARIKALASEATQERVLAKDVENIETGALNDSQHKSLDRIAKAVGMFKTSSDVNINFNAFVKPQLSPEQEKMAREFFDAIAVEVPSDH